MNTHEVLVKARNLLDREGWAQGRYHPSVGRPGYCVRGACYAAANGGEFRPTPRGLAAIKALAEMLGMSGDAFLLGWNDAEGRTKEEVLAAFDEAIRRTAPAPQDPLADVQVEEAVHA